MTLIEKLRAAIASSGMSPNKIARLAGVSPHTIASIMGDPDYSPTIRKYDAIMRALGHD